MTVIWLSIIFTVAIASISTYVGHMVFERPYYRAQAAEKENTINWTALTEADKEWFQANLWDGKKVLDERPEPSEPPRPRPIDCKHVNTVSETSIQDARVHLTCMNCGLTWAEDWDTWIED